MVTVLVTLIGYTINPLSQIIGTASAEGNVLTAVYVYDGSKTKYRDGDAESIDQMFYSFALFKKGHLSTAHWKNIKKFQAYIAKHPTIMPILSVGGWGADGFSQAASTAESRAVFVNDVLTLMQKYSFLGVDIDWEYPGSSDAGIHSSPDDRRNFTLLLQDVRDGLNTLTAEDGVARRLCIAISGSPELIPNLECTKIGAVVDQINLMTYDMQQPDLASHHSALFASTPDALSADVCVQAYVQAGVPAEKIMLGVAFYGYRWTTKNATPLYKPATQKGTLSYAGIVKLIKKKPDAVMFDDEAMAPYFFDGKVFISYDDERSIAQKRVYSQTQGLMGLFAWEYGSESTGTLVAAMRDL